MTRRLIWVGSQAEHDRPPRGVYLGVPAIVHRAVVTSASVSSDEVDPFENAVLGLVAAGVGRVPELAGHLGISDPKFVEHIVELARSHDLLTGGRRIVVTDRGRGLVEQRGVAGDQTSWFMLQDAITGQLWSRAVTRLTPVDVIPDGPRSTAELGTHGSPRPTRYWEMRWPNQPPTPPSSEAARAAVQRHLQSAQAARRAIAGAEFDHLPKPARHKRSDDVDVKLMPGLDEQVYVLVRVSRTTSPVDSSMTVHDPFGLAHLAALDHSVRDEIEQFEPLAAYVARGLDRLGQNARHSLAPPWEPLARQRMAAALLAAIERNPRTTFAGVSNLDSELAHVRLGWLGFDVPDRLPPLSPRTIQEVADGAPGLLHELLIAWIEGCPDDIGRRVAKRARRLVYVVVALGGDSDGTIDEHTALEAIAAVDATTDLATPRDEWSTQ